MKQIISISITTIIILGGFYVFAIDQNADETMCTTEYAPVCAQVQVQCIKAPCDPVKQTFGNMCELQKSGNAVFLYDGECKIQQTENYIDDDFRANVSKILDKYLGNAGISARLVDIINSKLNEGNLTEKVKAKLKYIRTYIEANK